MSDFRLGMKKNYTSLLKGNEWLSEKVERKGLGFYNFCFSFTLSKKPTNALMCFQVNRSKKKRKKTL